MPIRQHVLQHMVGVHDPIRCFVLEGRHLGRAGAMLQVSADRRAQERLIAALLDLLGIDVVSACEYQLHMD